MTARSIWARGRMAGIWFALLSTVVLLGASGSVAANAGPRAAYAFNEAAGQTVLDASGNANQGTFKAPGWTSGVHASAALFNGSTSRIAIRDSSSLDITGAVTLEAWVKPTALPSGAWATVVEKQQSGELVYALYASSDTSAPAGIVYVDGHEVILRGRSKLPLGTWTHLATTYDGSQLRLFINGVQVASQSVTGAMPVSSQQLSIGGNTVWGEHFSGAIDDVRIYSSALSAATLQSDMATGVTAGSDTQAPSAPGGLHVTASSQTSISLGWDASTDNVGVTGYDIVNGASIVGQAVGQTSTVSGLACGTTYTLGVNAFDAAGNHSGTSTTSASTSACADTQPPTTPTGLVETSSAQTSIALAWSASTDAVGVAGYGMYDSAALAGSTATTTGSVSGLSCGNTYSLSVDAFDAAGNRSAETTISASTNACTDTTPPSAPANLVAAGSTQGSISLDWSASSDNVAVTGYTVYQGVSTLGAGTAVSFTVSGLACGTSYTFSVDAYDAAGNHSAQTSLTTSTASCADTQAPSAPTGLAATAATASSVSISWLASTDNVGVTAYGIYQGAANVGTSFGTSSVVSGLSCGTAYTVSVDAADAAGNRSAKSSITVSTIACADTQAPSTPTNLQGTGSTTTSVSLGWGASTDNVAVTGYTVYQGGATAGSTGSTSYTVSALACGTAYSFSVDAFDAAGNRSGKAVVAMSTATCGTSTPTANLWVDTNGGSCTRQATSAGYADASACGSVTAAFAAASCGDTVGVATGSYAGVTFSQAKSCTPATPVTFSASGSVTFTSAVNITTSFLTFTGPFSFQNGWSIYPASTSYVSVIGATSSHGYIIGNHVLIKGGSVGPNNNCTTGDEDGIQIYDNGSAAPAYVTVDGVTIHDISDNGNQCAGTARSGVHTDCIQLLGASNITIENSTFYNCATSDVIGRPYTTPMHDVLIQNNMMAGVVTPGADINIGNSADVCNNVVVQYNTALGAYPSLICGAGGSGNIARGNIFAGYYAQVGFANSYNVTSATSPIGTGSKKCTPAFSVASSPIGNYRLAVGDTCAKNAGDPANYPAADIDGNPRPAGGVPDAGADEVG